jgi:uncharacterized damage-inducible protein DinB
MRASRFLIVLAAFVPMAVAEAQQPASQPANPIATAFRNRSSNLRRLIAQAYDSIPASKFGYKPTPAQQSFGYVAAHMASDAYFFCNNFSDRKATRPESHTTTPDSIKQHWPKDSLVAQMKAAFQFCDEVQANVDDASATAIVAAPTPANPNRQVNRFNALLGHAMDLQDHYSQIANYMRLNGMLPPSALPRPAGRGGN